MSIEKDLSRIADALEGINTRVQGLGQMFSGNPIPTPKKSVTAAATAVDTIPGMDDEAPAPVVDAAPTMTASSLRDLAQKYIQAAGDKTGKLVTFIQSVAKIFNPQEPKLIKIPAGKVGEAAKMIADWCEKNGINLPIEV